MPVVESSQDHHRFFPILSMLQRICVCILQRGDHGIGVELSVFYQ